MMPQTTSYQPLLEQWGEYELGGGILLRARFVMTLVEKPAANSDALGHIRVHTVLEVKAPTDLTGNPTPGIVDYTTRKVVREFKDWKTRSEALSIYLLPDGSMVRLRYRPRSVKQVDAFNKNREPILIVDSDTELTGDPSFEEMRKQHAQDRVARPKKKSR